jgi:hypothetical protein
MMFTLSSSEMSILAEYVKIMLQRHRDQDIGGEAVEDTAKFDEKAETRDDDVPF